MRDAGEAELARLRALRDCIMINLKNRMPRVEGLPLPWHNIPSLLALVDRVVSHDFA